MLVWVGGTLWCLQKCLQYVIYIILEFTPLLLSFQQNNFPSPSQNKSICCKSKHKIFPIVILACFHCPQKFLDLKDNVPNNLTFSYKEDINEVVYLFILWYQGIEGKLGTNRKDFEITWCISQVLHKELFY
jgi:hypothetical protein